MVKDLIMMFYKSTGGYKPHRVIMYRYVFTTLGLLCWEDSMWEDFWRNIHNSWRTEDFGRTLGGLWEDFGRTLGELWEVFK